MGTILSLEEEAKTTLNKVEEVDSITPTSTLRISFHSQLKVTFSFHRNLKVPGLSTRFVVSLAIKPLTATIEWTLHTRAGIHLPSLQQWLQPPMALKVEIPGSLTLGLQITLLPI
jgi:hypothetical protein